MKPRVSGWIWLFWLAAVAAAAAGDRKAPRTEAARPGGTTLKYEEPVYLTGAIYAPGPDKRLLFKFKRVADRSGSTLKVQRDYTYPDGRPAARERVVYEGDALVLYELEELQIGATGSARIRRADDHPTKGSIEFTYTSEQGGRPKTRSEALAGNTLMADMVGPFLADHWEALRTGEKVKCRYIVVPRRETVGFTFVKDSAAAREGRDVLIVRMEASSPILARLVEPLFFTMEQAPPHRVLQYVGRTTPKIQSGGKWRDLDAVTVFDWASAR